MVFKDKASAIRYLYYDKIGVFTGIAFFVSLFILISIFNGKPATNVLDLNNFSQIRLSKDAELARNRNTNCSIYDCFNVYRCGHHLNKIRIYVYPITEFTESEEDSSTWIGGDTKYPMSREFYQILKTLIDSPYYTSNPKEACIFVPSIDMLNQNLIDKNLVGKALASLKFWENGQNHLLFNMLPGEEPDYSTVTDVNTANAMIAGAGFNTITYRYGFDLSIPFYSPALSFYKRTSAKEQKHYFLISSQLNMFEYHRRMMQEIVLEDSNNNILLLQKCSQEVYEDKLTSSPELADSDIRCSFPGNSAVVYPDIMEQGTFCLIIRGVRLTQPNLLEAMATGCIPVIIADNIILPFEEVIDWSLIAITFREADLHSIMTVLRAVSKDRIGEMQEQGRFIYEKYFKDIPTIINTLIDELNDRVFPHLASPMSSWNLPEVKMKTQNPLFLPLIGSKSQGFTAVVLTYDRVDSLFTLITKLSQVPSLQKILVIWNNQKKSPPNLSQFPKITKPFKVIQTTANKLSNRFYPYPEIETEAVLTIDDDITMLTTDEVDFAFEVWREFPDRIVGFPSRTHEFLTDKDEWKYESEWTNQISMVLTGAAFHHKFWNYAYTSEMPGNIKEYVDLHFNCEDIAMNFLVANRTNKPPIKVTPRKKFKCHSRTCTNAEMLSADTNHMLERSTCINLFSKIYGTMPLKSVEFRADPVLYRDTFPEKLKRFNDVGSL